MRIARLNRIVLTVVAVCVAAACGSARPMAQSSPPSTTGEKLQLAKSASSAKPAADGGSGSAALYPERPTRYQLDAPLPDLGTTGQVWRLTGHDVQAADVRRFADALGLDASPVATPTGWVAEGSAATLRVDRSSGTAFVSYATGTFASPGSVDGSGGSSGSAGAGVGSTSSGVVAPDGGVNEQPVATKPAAPVDVPNAADAQTIARALLDRMDVLAGQEWSATVSDSGDIAVACAPEIACPSTPTEVSARTVTFSLEVEGRVVDGVGWSVTIGEHRRIESVDGQWVSPTPAGSYPLSSPSSVFADLQAGRARFAGPQPLAMDSGATGRKAPDTSDSTPTSAVPVVVVHVTGVSLGLARWDAVAGDATVVDLVPTYRFRAVVDGGTPYDIVLLALDPAAVGFVDPKPVPEPLPVEPTPKPGAVPPKPVPDPAGNLPADQPGAASR